jgi:hypothetical protein
VSTPENDYDLIMNVTLSNIEILNMTTTGFNVEIVESALSAYISLSNIFHVVISDFFSYNNTNLTIVNVNDIETVSMARVTCEGGHSEIADIEAREEYAITTGKSNLCFLIRDFYTSVDVQRLLLKNLVAFDNSFFAITSWNTMLFNTSAAGVVERVTLRDVEVKDCTIFIESISTRAGSIDIRSE